MPRDEKGRLTKGSEGNPGVKFTSDYQPPAENKSSGWKLSTRLKRMAEQEIDWDLVGSLGADAYLEQVRKKGGTKLIDTLITRMLHHAITDPESRAAKTIIDALINAEKLAHQTNIQINNTTIKETQTFKIGDNEINFDEQ